MGIDRSGATCYRANVKKKLPVTPSSWNIFVEIGLGRGRPLDAAEMLPWRAVSLAWQWCRPVSCRSLRCPLNFSAVRVGRNVSVVVPLIDFKSAPTATLRRFLLCKPSAGGRWLAVVAGVLIARSEPGGVMTTVWFILTMTAGALVAIGLLCLAMAQVSAGRHFTRARALPLTPPAPSVSILKPIEGTSPETYEALASFCRIEYPGPVEILVGTLRREDPVVPLVSRLQEAFPEREIRIVFAELLGVNRKTSIMETLWREASGEYLFFSDADVRVEPDYLARLMPELMEPGCGCVTCLPRGLRAETPGAKTVALHYGFNYLPQWMLALQTTGIDWAIGHTMAVPRAVLEQMGGFTSFLDHLADDYELGHRVAALGHRVILSPLLVECYMPQEDLAAAFRRLLRWKRTMRRARGVAFVGSSLTYPVFWAVWLVVLNPVAVWAWAVLMATVTIRFLLAASLQKWVRMPDWRRSWGWLPVVDLIDGLTFLMAYSGNTVTWAGRRYRLLPDGTLKPLRDRQEIEP